MAIACRSLYLPLVAIALAAGIGPASADTPVAPDAEPVKRPAVLTGTIRDESGRPLAGAKVILYGGLATRWRQQEATTDRHGVYLFDPLESGSYTTGDDGKLSARYIGMQVEHTTHVSADGNSWWDIQVPMRDGHVETRDFVLTLGGKVRGSIMDPVTGRGAKVDLRIYHESPGRHFRDYATTGESGEFVTAPLAPGLYTIDVNEPKLRFPKLGEAVVVAGKEAEFGTFFIAAPDGPAITGRIVDEAGRPMAGVRLILSREPESRDPAQTAETDAHGEYRFAPVQTGALVRDREGNSVGFATTLAVDHETHVSGDGASSWSVMLPLKTGHVESRDLVMVPGGTVKGLIRAAKDDSPVAHARVRLARVGEGRPPFTLRTVTGSGGRFTAAALAPGRYQVEVEEREGDRYMVGEVEVRAGEVTEVTFDRR